ncbi:MAG: serine protease [Actinobacteria bacterium]|nr:serine protease [Actinomycetota bacterium]
MPRSIWIALAGLTLVLSACSIQINTTTTTTSDDSGTSAPTDTNVPSGNAAATVPGGGAAGSTGGAVDANVQDARAAIVRVVAGPFNDPPEDEALNPVAAAATGFFIGVGGNILTTNRAVAGAENIDVYLADDPQPHAATVRAIDECSNLAVMYTDITDTPFLDNVGEHVAVGTHVSIGGYPQDTSEYTVTDGTVTGIDLRGQTTWFDIDSDALLSLSVPTRAGEGGAPVMIDDGSVVAIILPVDGTGTFAVPFWAIGAGISDLELGGRSGGSPLITIGLNTVPYRDPANTSGPDGLWVRAVVPNSAADQIALQPGDIIVSIDGRETASERGFDNYCIALHDHNAIEPIPIVVYRPGDDLFYEGVLGTDVVLGSNGQHWSNAGAPQPTGTTTVTKPLPPPTTTTVTKPLPPPTTTTLPTFGPPPGNDNGGFDWIKNTGFYLLPAEPYPAAYDSVDDAHHVIHAVKPDEWGLELSVDATPIYGSPDGPYGTGVQLYVIGSDTIGDYTTDWTTPGYQMGIAHKTPYDSWTPEMWVRSRDWSDRCTEGGIGVYDDGTYNGLYRFWHHCKTDYLDAVKLDIAAWNADHSVIIWISGLMFSEPDYDAFSKALDEHTFDTARLTSEGY